MTVDEMGGVWLSANKFYDLCNQHLNRAVEIRCLDGKVHRGVITKVDPQNVYIQPLDGAGSNAGPGLYYWGWGWGWGYPIALASIAAIAALAFW